MTTLTKTITTAEVAVRFNELATEEKWFDIQDELFAEQVKSIEPSTSPYLKNAIGKSNVQKKGKDWVALIQDVHSLSTTQPIVSDNHFAVARVMDLTVKGFGRVVIHEIMLYEVKDGQIISEQFFY